MANAVMIIPERFRRPLGQSEPNDVSVWSIDLVRDKLPQANPLPAMVEEVQTRAAGDPSAYPFLVSKVVEEFMDKHELWGILLFESMHEKLLEMLEP